MNQNSMADPAKPDFVLTLEAAYGPPSQEGFGSAVFFTQSGKDDDIEQLARHYYQHFVGDLWERWGADT